METTPFGLVLIPPVPNPYREFFFLDKNGYAGVRMQQYPSSIGTHEVSGTDTASILPYRCFLDNNSSKKKININNASKSKLIFPKRNLKKEKIFFAMELHHIAKN